MVLLLLLLIVVFVVCITVRTIISKICMKMIRVPIVFRGPNGAAAGVTAQHSQVESRVNLIKAMTSSRYPPPPPPLYPLPSFPLFLCFVGLTFSFLSASPPGTRTCLWEADSSFSCSYCILFLSVGCVTCPGVNPIYMWLVAAGARAAAAATLKVPCAPK